MAAAAAGHRLAVLVGMGLLPTSSGPPGHPCSQPPGTIQLFPPQIISFKPLPLNWLSQRLPVSFLIPWGPVSPRIPAGSKSPDKHRKRGGFALINMQGYIYLEKTIFLHCTHSHSWICCLYSAHNAHDEDLFGFSHQAKTHNKGPPVMTDHHTIYQ